MQILKALRLSEIPYRIVGTDMSAYSIGLTEVDHAYLLPPASSPTYIDSLLKACSKHQVQALFHGSESELKVMNAQRQRLLAAGLFVPINPANVIDQCMDKLRTAEFLESNGFNVPAYASISDHKQAGQFERFPAVLKPAVGGGGSANVLLAQDKDEMLALSALLLKSHSQIIAQQYIGTPESEYSVGVLTDMDGKLLNSIALRRNILSALSNRIKTANRTDDQALGPVLAVSNGVSQGEIGRFPAVTEECERIALALGATGAINIQCRLVNGKVFVFEINPTLLRHNIITRHGRVQRAGYSDTQTHSRGGCAAAFFLPPGHNSAQSAGNSVAKC